MVRWVGSGRALDCCVWAWLCGAVLLVAGCSPDGPPPNGVVKFDDGQAVQSGAVEFRSTKTGKTFSGRISHDGTFTLADKRGTATLPLGDYEVVVVQVVVIEDLAADLHEHGRTVPRHYADYYTSGLRIKNAADRRDPLVVTLVTPE